MTDRELVLHALAAFARTSRNEARGRVWTGPQFADLRARLRAESKQAERLADELRAGRVIVV